MPKRIAAVFISLLALCTVSAAQTQSPDPWIGTWTIDLAKSKFSPGPPPKVPGTTKLESAPGGMKFTNDGTDAEGKPFHTEFVATFDGNDVPVKGARLPNTTTAYKRIDDRTFELMGRVDGKPTVTTRAVLSADGKTLTATQTGKNAQGETVNNVIVFSKQ